MNEIKDDNRKYMVYLHGKPSDNTMKESTNFAEKVLYNLPLVICASVMAAALVMELLH